MFSVCVCVCVFCVCVQVGALRRADHPSKESYRLSLIKKLRKLSPMLQSGSKLPRVGATRKKKKDRIVGTTHTCLAVAKQRPDKQRLLGNNLVAVNRALANHGLGTSQCLATAM
jgi:hypothetical protein